MSNVPEDYGFTKEQVIAYRDSYNKKFKNFSISTADALIFMRAEEIKKIIEVLKI